MAQKRQVPAKRPAPPARASTAPRSISSDQVTKVDEAILKGYKTIDDVTVEETSGGDIDVDTDERAETPETPFGATVARADESDYPWVVRFAVLTNQNVEKLVAQAREDGAPADAVTKKSTGWITYPNIAQELGDSLSAVKVVTG